MRSEHVDPKLELRHLLQNQGVNINLDFSESLIFSVVQQLGLIKLQKVSFVGTILPLDKGDWVLSSKLGASIEQPCSLTLLPVRTRIETQVTRIFRKSLLPLLKTTPVNEFISDDNDEQLYQVIDIFAIFCEALSLEIPDYPRTENVEATIIDYGPPGTEALTDDTVKPFAILAGLKGKMK